MGPVGSGDIRDLRKQPSKVVLNIRENSLLFDTSSRRPGLQSSKQQSFVSKHDTLIVFLGEQRSIVLGTRIERR
jgi:hypothetical protein